MKKKIRVGIIGYSGIGKIHAFSYRNIPFYYKDLPVEIELAGVCNRTPESVEEACREEGFRIGTTDYLELINSKEIDIISCCTPNDTHKDIIISCLKAGKPINCEKPLCRNVSEAKEILKYAEKYPDTVAQITYMYRNSLPIIRARQMIGEGFLGKVYVIRGKFLHSGYENPNRPMSWRMDFEKSGGGALFDLGSHVIDLIYFLLGDFKRVKAMLDTYIKERPDPNKPDIKHRVTVDDAAYVNFELENGATGYVEASRFSTGTNDELILEIHGDRGAIKFNGMDPNWLKVYDSRDEGEPIGGRRGFKAIETVQRYPSPPSSNFPGPKFALDWSRYHMDQCHEFIMNAIKEQKPECGLESGYKVQEILEAALISHKEDRWVELKQEPGI
ncbi:MAG: Gfo/Idh/MocA family oxidoreductase [Actinomycetota bacterium]|nr:MAG: Gfo/Idh/MocA family oxidoreductase [Actinomycetota bacterium]